MIEVSGKIKWQSRRGMRELDLMLLPFVEIDLPKLTNQDLEEYVDLLEASDLELVRWFNGTAEPQSENRKRILSIIKECHKSRLGKEGV